MVMSRFAFAGYFLLALWAIKSNRFGHSDYHFIWFLYVLALYYVAERLYNTFLNQSIDLTYAFPILFAIYCLNLVTLLLGGQDRLPLLNRTEHFASFLLLAYVVWVFFTKYLPQDVWKDHPYYTALLVLSVTSLLGVSNEVVELVIDHLFGTKYVGRHFDTSLDLLMNTLGSILFLAVRLILGSAPNKRIAS